MSKGSDSLAELLDLPTGQLTQIKIVGKPVWPMLLKKIAEIFLMIYFIYLQNSAFEPAASSLLNDFDAWPC